MSDVADAFLSVLDADRDVVHDRAFNVGSEEGNYRIKELAHVAGEVTGAPVAILGSPDPDARSYRVSFARLRQALPAFSCRWTARAGAGELADAYREYGLTKEQFERRFTRLAVIAALQGEGRIGADLRPVT